MIGFDGAMNTGLTLRTARHPRRRGGGACRATLLFDSDPLAVERETELKARALLETLAEARPQPRKIPLPNETQGRHCPRPVRASCQAGACGCSWWIVRITFVHTLASYFREQGAQVATLRAGLPLAALDEFAPDLVVLSRGPGPVRFWLR